MSNVEHAGPYFAQPAGRHREAEDEFHDPEPWAGAIGEEGPLGYEVLRFRTAEEAAAAPGVHQFHHDPRSQEEYEDELADQAVYREQHAELPSDPGEIPPAPAPIVVVVVGSFAWDNSGAVTDALVNLWQSHDRVPLHLVTSGCPNGAEAIAVDMAGAFGWSVSSIRDEELLSLPSALVLGFIKDRSVGASDVLEHLEEKFWTRIYTERTGRKVSAWASR